VSCPKDSFYRRPTEVVAKELIGKKLVRMLKKDDVNYRLAGIIVETEAYGYRDDPASHAYSGMTQRNKVMFGNVGRAYVYFTYGNHFCVNVSARSKEVNAGAVLIRGIMPVEGIDIMRQFRIVNNRGGNIFSLTSGPGKLTQALSIKSMLNGTDVTDIESELHIEFGLNPLRIVSTSRIGITKATDKNWRFLDASSPFVSRKITQLKM
jgi:DNA-3-methyladenine glycosylase